MQGHTACSYLRQRRNTNLRRPGAAPFLSSGFSVCVMNMNHPRDSERAAPCLLFLSSNVRSTFLHLLSVIPRDRVWCVGGASVWTPFVAWFCCYCLLLVTAAQASRHGFLPVPVSRGQADCQGLIYGVMLLLWGSQGRLSRDVSLVHPCQPLCKWELLEGRHGVVHLNPPAEQSAHSRPYPHQAICLASFPCPLGSSLLRAFSGTGAEWAWLDSVPLGARSGCSGSCIIRSLLTPRVTA